MNETTFCIHLASTVTASIYGVRSIISPSVGSFRLLFFLFQNFLHPIDNIFRLRHDILLRTAARAQGLPIFHQVMPRVVLIRRSGSWQNVSSAFGVEKRVRRMQGPLKWS